MGESTSNDGHIFPLVSSHPTLPRFLPLKGIEEDLIPGVGDGDLAVYLAFPLLSCHAAGWGEGGRGRKEKM